MTEKDTYNTITKASEEVIFKEKNSKFLGYAFPIKSEDDVKIYLENLKKQHHSARHWCYAYQLGVLDNQYLFRVNDDGEPNNSAGMPIYGQIQSYEVTNILVVVVRYFGGTKLGVGGLITAYKTTAQMALEQSKIVTKTINQELELKFEYKDMNKVMRIIKEKNLKISNQTLELTCTIVISVRLKNIKPVLKAFEPVFGIELKVLND